MSFAELRPFIRGPQEAEGLWILGALYMFRAAGADSGDAYTLVEVQGREGLAIPHHVHEHEEEGFYVVSGEVTLVLGDRSIKASAGSFAFAPRGVPHAFRLDSEDAKLLLLITPGAAGHESFFREIGEPALRYEIPPPPAEPPDPGRLSEVASKHGTRVVGPPPAPENFRS